VIIRYIGTTKQALTFHIKPLGPITVSLLLLLMALLLLRLDVTVRLWLFTL
jgi:hypothetical protein